MALLHHDQPVLFPDVTTVSTLCTAVYTVSAYRQIPLTDSLEIIVDAFCGRANGGIVFPNPNAPTGRLLVVRNRAAAAEQYGVGSRDRRGLRGFRRTSACPGAPLLPVAGDAHLVEVPLACGLRVGYAIGIPNLIEALIRVKDSFNSYPWTASPSRSGAALEIRTIRSRSVARDR